MVLERHSRAVATFNNRQDAERALNKLNSTRFSNAQIVVLAKDIDCDVRHRRTGISDRFEDEAQSGTATGGPLVGSMLGAIGGCLLGLGILSVPGIGLAVTVGTSGTALFTTLAGAGIGAASGGLIEVFVGSEIPEDKPTVGRKGCSEYEYLVMIDGTDREVRRAQSLLKSAVLN